MSDDIPTGGESNFEKYFSYSLDPMISSFEDEEILKCITDKYPEFLPTTCEKDLRKIFLDILLDRKMIKYLMKHYAMNLKDLITIIYHNYPFLFNSSVYVRKIYSMVRKSRFLKCAGKKKF